MKVKRPTIAPCSARDRRDAARVLRTARDLLVNEGDPFPVLEAARRVGVRTNSPAWTIAFQAREIVGGRRDAEQLRAAADLIEQSWPPATSPAPKLTRVPRCRQPATGGRCSRPLGHPPGCTLEPSPGDLVRSVGTEHVLVGDPPTGTTMLVAWEVGTAGTGLRVRRDDHGRGLWIDCPAPKRPRGGKPLLLGWPEIKRLALDLNLELAERGTATTPRSAGSRPPPQRNQGPSLSSRVPGSRAPRRHDDYETSI